MSPHTVWIWVVRAFILKWLTPLSAVQFSGSSNTRGTLSGWRGCWQTRGEVEGTSIGLVRFTCTADLAAGRGQRRPEEGIGGQEKGDEGSPDRGHTYTPVGLGCSGTPDGDGARMIPHNPQAALMVVMHRGHESPQSPTRCTTSPHPSHRRRCCRDRRSSTTSWPTEPRIRWPMPEATLLLRSWDGSVQPWAEPDVSLRCTGFDVQTPVVLSRARHKSGKDVDTMLPGQAVCVGRSVRAGALLVLRFPRLQTPPG